MINQEVERGRARTGNGKRENGGRGKKGDLEITILISPTT
jgi:hypothetical protein